MKKTLILLISLFLINSISAQNKMELNIGYEGMSFIELTLELESKYQIQTFYYESWVKDIKLKKNYSNIDLQSLITDVLSGTKIQFLIKGNSLILTQFENLNHEFNFQRKINDVQPQVVENEILENDLSILQQQEYVIHEIGVALGHKKVKVFGNITLFETGQPLKGVEVYLPNMRKGVTSDKDGYFGLELTQGSYVLNFKHMGLKKTVRKINLRGDGRLNVQMIKEAQAIKEVKVFAKDNNVKRTAMGIEHFVSKDIESLPSALGEPDIIKSTTMLPGVESAGEGAIGFNVRGGSADQNLILIDNAPIYYPAHFFGFFSAFNNDMIQDASLYKSSIPIQFGGRISSTYDIHSSENIADEINGKVGVSPITSKAYLNLPLLKKKLSIMNSFRFTYSDWIIKKIDSKELVDSKSNFYDLHGKILYKPNFNNQIELSYYNSKDEFQLHSDTVYNFNNFVSSINWRYRFSEKLKMKNSAHFTSFSYDMASNDIPSSAFKLTHQVKDIGFKSHLTYEKNVFTKFDFGAAAKYYEISPGELKPNSKSSLVTTNKIDIEKGLETAIFAGAKFDLFGFINAEAGFRYSLYGNLGKRKEALYEGGIPNSLNRTEIQNTSGGLNNIYHGPEVRFSINYAMNNNNSFKASYNRTRQYIHLLSNTTSISPTDTWKLSDRYLKPQIGDQFSMGYYRSILGSLAELSVEAYTKRVKNAKDYKDGAELYLNKFTETEVLNADGKNYGVEFLLRKKSGRFNGMVSYSYSRSYLKSKDQTGAFAVNDGEWYRAPYDKPHNLKAFLSFKLSRRFIFSTNLVYHTGRPATYPTAKYQIQNIPIVYYSKRNEYRLPNYFRSDITLLVEGNLKKHKNYHTSWSFGIYNLTGQRNTYSSYFRIEDSNVVGYKLSVFGEAIPTITYNIEF
ncbi:TonB-dependent receptor [Ancylomarina salipaludis]|uniref:TonB-dependent receptor n=1 Tax=Ancylomarina salipaludis TaxID=2501299 RepID=A0A4Q1JKG0_9BACT|nr:carboxypeptidase-like regulatory domain-containing protein [Ancylomarina salipaludis]RXQ92997.1 TonB-dependent receptor [Ancylomarina salipaludis]